MALVWKRRVYGGYTEVPCFTVENGEVMVGPRQNGPSLRPQVLSIFDGQTLTRIHF